MEEQRGAGEEGLQGEPASARFVSGEVAWMGWLMFAEHHAAKFPTSHCTSTCSHIASPPFNVSGIGSSHNIRIRHGQSVRQIMMR